MHLRNFGNFKGKKGFALKVKNFELGDFSINRLKFFLNV